jgi:hypothetical protein
VALLGVIAFAYTEIVLFSVDKLQWPQLVGRIFLSVTVAVLAAYAGFQADKERGTEQRNRKLALELEALGPYLASLEKGEQDKFRLELAVKIFGKDELVQEKQGDRSPATVLDVVSKAKDLRELLVDLVKAASRQGA